MKRKIALIISSVALVALLAVTLCACSFNVNVTDPDTGDVKTYHIDLDVPGEIAEAIPDTILEEPEVIVPDDGPQVINPEDIIDIEGDEDNGYNINIGKGFGDLFSKDSINDFFESIGDYFGESFGNSRDGKLEENPEVIVPDEEFNYSDGDDMEKPNSDEEPAAPKDKNDAEKADEGSEKTGESVEEPEIIEVTEIVPADTSFDEDFKADVFTMATGWMGLSGDRKQIKIEMDTDPEEGYGWSVAISNDALMKMNETGDAETGAHTDFFAEDKGTDYGIFKGRRASDGSYKTGNVTLLFTDVKEVPAEDGEEGEVTYEEKVAVYIYLHVNSDGTIDILDSPNGATATTF